MLKGCGLWTVYGAWVEVADLMSGQKLVGFEGKALTVTSVIAEEKPQDVVTYNIEVADNHNYYAGSSQALVHNCNCTVGKGKPGSYTPDRQLPTKGRDYIPDSDVPHTQLGRSKPKYGSEPQAREWGYGENGKLQPKYDIDFSDHGFPDQHPYVPHKHKLTPNSPKLAPKGGFKRGKGEPM